MEATRCKNDQDPLPKDMHAMQKVLVHYRCAPKEERNNDHDQDSLKKDLLHIRSWSCKSEDPVVGDPVRQDDDKM